LFAYKTFDDGQKSMKIMMLNVLLCLKYWMCQEFCMS